MCERAKNKNNSKRNIGKASNSSSSSASMDPDTGDDLCPYIFSHRHEMGYAFAELNDVAMQFDIPTDVATWDS